MFVLFGKIVMSMIWCMMLINLFFPFPAPANIFVNGALILFVVSHGLQAWLLNQTLTQKEKKTIVLWRLFFFGPFEALSWKKRQNSQN